MNMYGCLLLNETNRFFISTNQRNYMISQGKTIVFLEPNQQQPLLFKK